MRHPDYLHTDDELQLKALLTRSPELAAVDGHVRTFATIMSNREGHRLRGWIADVCADEQCGLTSFAAGLITDLDAVVFGMSTDWSSGPVEGRVNDPPPFAAQAGPCHQPSAISHQPQTVTDPREPDPLHEIRA
ncbi:hypothetical protein [Streptomyces sp. NBC_01262]|uniref:hypothetical protein n=1 Tax=Streptomyces sp. NBC_01262 TaxID=2903803 RepID=UPI002E35C751|nr:hypothetical protein [Streptomyces sp. NBC_01262]